MSNNFITIIKSANFIRVTSLKHLDLSYNSIAEIEPQAFEQLQFLRHLDLSNNELIVVPTNVFRPLIALETLILSNNDGIGRLMTTASLYLHLSVTPTLQSIFMERCNLSTINLRQGDGLLSVNLAFNNISDFSTIALPDAVESLDLSGNPVWDFTAKSLPHLASLRELMLRVNLKTFLSHFQRLITILF
jgi:Leucine-rich repeat (LRR) protein